MWHLLLLLTRLVTSSQKVSSSGATTLNLGGQSPVEPFMPKKRFLWGPNSSDGVPGNASHIKELCGPRDRPPPDRIVCGLQGESLIHNGTGLEVVPSVSDHLCSVKKYGGGRDGS